MLLFKPSCRQEIEFYKAIATRDDTNVDSGDVPLKLWMPTFFGMLQGNVTSLDSTAKPHQILIDEEFPAVSNINQTELPGDGPYLVLENLLYGYLRPNIIDIKLGRKLWDEMANEDKKSRLQKVSDSTTSGSLGFRVCGMSMETNDKLHDIDEKYYEAKLDNYVTINKFYGRDLSADNVISAFELFFAGHGSLSSEQKSLLVDAFLKRLQLFYNTILSEEIRMISSSLLFIYEGDATRWKELSNDNELIPSHFEEDSDSCDESSSEELDKHKRKVLSQMALIDFAHTKITPNSGIDEDVADGVENLIIIFEKLKSRIACKPTI